MFSKFFHMTLYHPSLKIDYVKVNFSSTQTFNVVIFSFCNQINRTNSYMLLLNKPNKYNAYIETLIPFRLLVRKNYLIHYLASSSSYLFIICSKFLFHFGTSSPLTLGNLSPECILKNKTKFSPSNSMNIN